MLYNFPFYLEHKMSRAFPTPNKSKVRSAQFFSLIEPSQSLSNYNNQLIIWITTFNAESSITRSCYLRLTLYGYRETPFSNHFMKTCNPKSIKPTDYKRRKVINK